MTIPAAHRGHWKTLTTSYDAALERLPAALAAEGFGVITRINMKETLKAKLGVDVPRYEILGACNPAFAHKALAADPRAGLLLPCNVVLYEGASGEAVLGVIDPIAQLGAGTGLDEVATEVARKLARVAAAMT